MLSEQLNVTELLCSGDIKMEDLMRLTGGVLCWRRPVTYISLYFIGLTLKVGFPRRHVMLPEQMLCSK